MNITAQPNARNPQEIKYKISSITVIFTYSILRESCVLPNIHSYELLEQERHAPKIILFVLLLAEIIIVHCVRTLTNQLSCTNLKRLKSKSELTEAPIITDSFSTIVVSRHGFCRRWISTAGEIIPLE